MLRNKCIKSPVGLQKPICSTSTPQVDFAATISILGNCCATVSTWNVKFTSSLPAHERMTDIPRKTYYQGQHCLPVPPGCTNKSLLISFQYVRQAPIPMNQKSSNKRVPKQQTWAAFCAGLYSTAGDDASKDTLPEREMNDEYVVSDCVSWLQLSS